MVFLPAKDDLVPYAVGEGALAGYSVVSVRFEFRKVTLEGEEDGPQEVVTGLSYCTPVVTVKEGT